MSEIKALVSAADRAFVRSLIREMRAAIAANPEAPTVTTGPLDPDILEHVLNIALSAEALSHREGWRPISEAQPSGKVLSTRYDVDDGQWNAAVVSTPICYPYTHWMPLPPSPPGGEE